VLAKPLIERLAPGHVDQPDHPDGRIDPEPPQRPERLADLELKQCVGKVDRLAEVIERVVDPLAHRLGRSLGIAHGDGRNDGIIDRLDRLEADLVDGGRRIARRGTATGNDDRLGIGLRRLVRG
jgi:hypothetical protein